MKVHKLLRALALAGVTALALAPSALANVPNPLVQGPIQGGIRGYPWNHSLFALSGPGYRYTEKEYFFSGTAHDLTTGLSAPYESRMLGACPAIRGSSAARSWWSGST